jgi:hypothetical protein
VRWPGSWGAHLLEGHVSISCFCVHVAVLRQAFVGLEAPSGVHQILLLVVALNCGWCRGHCLLDAAPSRWSWMGKLPLVWAHVCGGLRAVLFASMLRVLRAFLSICSYSPQQPRAAMIRTQAVALLCLQ